MSESGRPFLIAVALDEPGAKEIYADWLDEHGWHISATHWRDNRWPHPRTNALRKLLGVWQIGVVGERPLAGTNRLDNIVEDYVDLPWLLHEKVFAAGFHAEYGSIEDEGDDGPTIVLAYLHEDDRPPVPVYQFLRWDYRVDYARDPDMHVEMEWPLEERKS